MRSPSPIWRPLERSSGSRVSPTAEPIEMSAILESHSDTTFTDSVTDYGDAFPSSRKVYLDGPDGVRVPVREISLSGGEPPLRVYDTSGPRGHDVRDGLPPLRAEWIASRGDTVPVDRSYRPIPGIKTVELPQGLVRRALRGTGCV